MSTQITTTPAFATMACLLALLSCRDDQEQEPTGSSASSDTKIDASGNWNPNLPSDAFWTGLDQTMAGHLGANHAAWQAAAIQMELDR